MSDDADVARLPAAKSERPSGRTGWDVLHSMRWIIVVIVALAAVVTAVYIALGRGYLDPSVLSAAWTSVVDIWNEYNVLLAAPVIGYAAGWYLASHRYEPPCKLLIWPRLEGSRIDILEVPDKRFAQLTPRGNCMVFHTGCGTEAYMIKYIDKENNAVEWADAHEHDPLKVISYIDAYMAFRQDLTDTKLKYLRIMYYPEVIAAGITENQLSVVLDALMSELKIPEDIESEVKE